MTILGVDHFNICTSDLDRTRKFYADILGLRDGDRPPFARPGAWMYIGDQPILHISTSRVPQTRRSDAFDHIALRGEGLDRLRAVLKEKGVYFEEFGVPDRNLFQVFFRDPDGTELEIVFTGEEARNAIAAGAKLDATAGKGRGA